MISGEQLITFVWRCSDCVCRSARAKAYYSCTPTKRTVLPLRGRLVKDVEPAIERHHCQPVIPEPLRGTLLHRQLEWRESVEVTVGGGQDRHTNVFST
jgi:hypothetical protein